jgi:hypothetical protein
MWLYVFLGIISIQGGIMASSWKYIQQRLKVDPDFAEKYKEKRRADQRLSYARKKVQTVSEVMRPYHEWNKPAVVPPPIIHRPAPPAPPPIVRKQTVSWAGKSADELVQAGLIRRL